MYIMYPFSKICNKDLATRQLQQIWLSYFVTSARYAYLTIIFHICRWCAREMSFSGVLRDRDVLNNWNILTLMYVYDDRDISITIISIELIKYVIRLYEMAHIGAVDICTICISCLSYLFKLILPWQTPDACILILIQITFVK